MNDDEPRSPLELLEALTVEEAEIAPGLIHMEIYTMRGLLSALWHGSRESENVVVTCGGGMGSMLGPANALYHDLGVELAQSHGIGTIRVGYRKPNDLSRCVHDLAALADLAGRRGARRFVTVGHSFGGAVAIQAGIVLSAHCRGVVTLATQSAGCEHASELRAPLLLFHGTDDEILPPETSAVVQMLAGQGEIVVLPGTGHLLTDAAAEIRARLYEWIPARFTA